MSAGRRRGRGLFLRFALLAIAFLAPAVLANFASRGPAEASSDAARREEEYWRELRLYVWGIGLAFVLTAIPFALVHWHMLSPAGLFVSVAAFALVQIIVHFRCFLHIDPPNQNTDDLMLILFTTLLLCAMGGGTIWILGDLAARMR